MISVTVTVQWCEHNTERSCPLAEQDEQVMPQALLREEKPPVVN